MAVYGFIGTGNMGGALARAAAKGGAELVLADMNRASAEKLAADIGGRVADNKTVAKEADFIFLGVKPQNAEELMADIRPVLMERSDEFTIVSFLAGKSIGYIRDLAGDSFPVIRLMPNTPVGVGEGMVLYASEDVSDERLEEFLGVMKAGGRFQHLKESLIDAATAVTGCGPAYVDLFVEALADGAVLLGVPRAQATEFAAQMVVGSAKLILESGKHPGQLKDAVCSPAGSTIVGVKALEEGAFRATVMNAVIAAYEKNKKL
ncbi:MAG: pyrroline-5-carboxylate reductase [Firmicutes bacterium]|jgi:pyrroline-5-carboxylate reductase|nr:pyrroline-5-carboxylate reductase [Bacillota bacterium]MBQ4372199.1 pyrroline-5-carboxylate reductase [Bacillota bacterium]